MEELFDEVEAVRSLQMFHKDDTSHFGKCQELELSPATICSIRPRSVDRVGGNDHQYPRELGFILSEWCVRSKMSVRRLNRLGGALRNSVATPEDGP